MSSTADIADSASAVQESLTAAEAELVARLGALPSWYLTLRNNVHNLVSDSAYAVGEDSGGALMGFRCREGHPHQATCEAYRAAEPEPDALVSCPQCRSEVHKLFLEGICYRCWTANRGES